MAPPSPVMESVEPLAAEPEVDGRNVGSLEGAVSLTLGVLLIVAAVFPRSIKQLLMLGIGGGLAYRGVTGQCGVYKSLGVDTTQ